MTKPRNEGLEGQEGFALLSVIVLLIALAIVGGTAALLSSNETKVAGLYNVSDQASSAAGAGLEHATAHFVTNGSTTGWPVSGTIDGYAYSVSLARDSFDFGSGKVAASWSTGSGYNGTGDGQPVWVLTSTATRGVYRATQILRLTAQTLDIKADAAFTSNSGIQLRGNITISGINTNQAGVPVNPTSTQHNGSCNENKPAIKLTDPGETVDSKGSVNLYGNASFATSNPPFVAWDSSTKYHTPEEALGLPQGALENYKQSGSQYDSNPPDTLSGIVYVTDDFGSSGAGSGNISGSGVLIVHNPLFNPREHDPNDVMYDAAKASDPKYAPANIGNVNGGVFHGLIIADKIDKINGNVQIYGAVESLTEIDVNIVGAGTATIKYSCSSIQQVSSSLLAPRRLAWVSQ